MAHLAPDNELYKSLRQLYDELAASPLAPLFALLPPESWHMTVLEGVCEQVRTPGYWPHDLPADAPLEQCTALFTEKLKKFDIGDDGEPPYRMAVAGFSSFTVGIGIALRAQTADEEARLRGLRGRLSDTLQIRHPHHDLYGLHISMAYFLRYLDPQQTSELSQLLQEHLEAMPKEFELGAPEFCTFENMFSFERVFYLGRQA